MGARLRSLRSLKLALLLLPISLLLGGCLEGNPYSTLTDRGNVSDQILDLFWPVFGVAVIVFFAVEGLLLFTVLRFHSRRQPRLPVQTHGNTKLELTWTIVPAVILAVIAIPTIDTIVDLSRRPTAAENPLAVRVIAQQFWWEFQIKNPANPEQTIYAANELHIPIGRKVVATIESKDVIHSFHVPNLAGKQDAIPGHRNDLIFDAKQPGRYQAQCAEFCGASHALMRFIVIAEPEADFTAWLARQAQPRTAAPATGVSPSVARGQQLFFTPENRCIGCHAIEGTIAQARIAPNLTQFGARTTLGANRLDNTPENVARWITNPQQYKPGALMPSFRDVLSEEDIRAIADYLQTLR